MRPEHCIPKSRSRNEESEFRNADACIQTLIPASHPRQRPWTPPHNFMATRKRKQNRLRWGYAGVFTFLTGFYLSQTWPWNRAEVIAAAMGAALVTALFYGMREAVDVRYSVRASWFGTLAFLLSSRTPKDCLLVLSSLTRKRAGEACAIPFDKEAFGHETLNAGHRAMVITGVSVGPNTVVIDVDPDDDRLIVHQLVHTDAPPGGGRRLWPIDL